MVKSFISFSCCVWVLLLDKLADEIDLDLFRFFTVYSVSVLLEALDLSNDLDLSNAAPSFDLLIIDLSFLFLDACGLSISLTVLIFFP